MVVERFHSFKWMMITAIVTWVQNFITYPLTASFKKKINVDIVPGYFCIFTVIVTEYGHGSILFVNYENRILKMSMGKKKNRTDHVRFAIPCASFQKINFRKSVESTEIYWFNFWTMIRMDLTSRELRRVQTENSSARIRDTSHSSFRHPEVPEPPRYNLTV